MTASTELADTVFAKAGPEHVRLDPFPHLVVEDALPTDRYARLLRSRPGPPPEVAWGHANHRYPVLAWIQVDVPAFSDDWRTFAQQHTRPAITRRVRELFEGHLAPGYPNVEGHRFGLFGRETFKTSDVLVDARCEVITPPQHDWGSHRRGHLDGRNRLFTALYYLRCPCDDSEGGGLDLFRWRDTPTETQKEAFQLDETTEIERVATLPYRGNTLVCFPNCVDALHGQSLRAPTPHDRAYVFITAEVEESWF